MGETVAVTEAVGVTVAVNDAVVEAVGLNVCDPVVVRLFVAVYVAEAVYDAVTL